AWVDCTTAFNDKDFRDSNSDFQDPHDNIHIMMGGPMQNRHTAAQDPIFFVHHSNVDRLWNLWLAKGGGRADLVKDQIWGVKEYTFFNENTVPVKMTSCDVLRAAQQLGYTYECEPTQIKPVCVGPEIEPPVTPANILVHLPTPPELYTEKVSISIDLGE